MTDYQQIFKEIVDILHHDYAGYEEKQTKISSTNQGHGLCYYFFIVEVKKSRPTSGTI